MGRRLFTGDIEEGTKLFKCGMVNRLSVEMNWPSFPLFARTEWEMKGTILSSWSYSSCVENFIDKMPKGVWG